MKRFIADVRGRMAALRQGAAEDAALREEMRFHQDMEAQHLGSARSARIAFGSEERWLEESRDARGVRVLQEFAQDVRYALRDMRRRPGFALLAVLTLALGLGSVTLVFSVANRLMLQPVAGVHAADELRLARVQRDRWNAAGISWANFEDMRAAAPAFTALAAHSGPRRMQLREPGGRGGNVEGETIAGDFFGVLGMTPAAGRFFTAAELDPRASGDVVVISARLWRERFGAAPVAGLTLELNRRTYEVIGVAAAGFHGVDRSHQADVWLPPASYPHTSHRAVDVAARGTGLFFELVGRIEPTVHDHVAEQQLAVTLGRLIAAYPDDNGHMAQGAPRVHAGIGVAPAFREQLEQLMRRLFLIAGVVLLIACANVGNLLLFRALRMRGESAVRRALGASAARLLRLHAAQAFVLAAAGSALGLLAVFAVLAAAGSVPLPPLGAVSDVAIDGRVLGFTLLLTLATALLFTPVPSLLTRGMDLVTSLRASARTATGSAGLLRRALVVVQLALSIALIVPAVLLSQSVRNLRSVELGFDPRNVQLFEILPGPQGYDDDGVRTLRHRLLEQVQQHSGIEAVALSATPPFTFIGNRVELRGPRQPEGADAVNTDAEWVSRDFFRTLGVHVPGSAPDPHGLPVDGGVILNERAARDLFGSTDVIGRSIAERGFHGPRTHTVAAVIPDIRGSDLREVPGPAVYLPMDDTRDDSFYLLVRSRLGEAQVAAIVDDVLAAIDPALPVYRSAPISDGVKEAMQGELLFARLSSTLGAVAALLAAIGLYGLLAHSVAQRTREIGIRMALGARLHGILRLVAADTAPLLLTGLALGCLAGWAIARLLQHLLFGVTLLAPGTYAAVVILFIAIGAAAAAGPARTAARVEPAVTLRAEG